jgi:hypothetical protein
MSLLLPAKTFWPDYVTESMVWRFALLLPRLDNENEIDCDRIVFSLYLLRDEFQTIHHDLSHVQMIL